ncbi:MULTISPECIES: S1C family serine protease [Sphingobacterium]|jgi:S1-C subfamily serine protease|uniref:S1C family serine protease n=1 Tax=Sphingobacterium TaxID=28453 RepID=UPI0010C54879|nr:MULTISPECIES: serine protease [Sphingobacterium]MCT1531880.1 serine protease [Sphingobacterium daejeonense]VTP88471.1 Probable periplasmic serine endoprotease DegP-like precursor [Sphingobacterium daejeonense]
MRQQEFLELADRYLNGQMSPKEREEFELLCNQDQELNALYLSHAEFVQTMKRHDARAEFKNQLATTIQEQPSAPIIVRMWKKLKINAVAAAAVAVLSSLATLYSTGYFSTLRRTNSDYSALKREINNVKRNVNAHNNAIRNINNKENTPKDPLQFGATGFMLTKDGYAVTNYHVVSGADSIHLQNSKGNSFKASVIFTDPEKDLAILHISDSSFAAQAPNIPYTFKKQNMDLGEGIYTIGYPRDEAVYGEGYLSSSTGYSGDTTAYQISVPVNPGNSGGPVLDKNGNIIGIISGKQKGIDGAAFAIKTKALIETLNRIPEESLKGNIVLNNKNSLSNLPRTEQIKKLQDYIYMVKVY